MTATLLVVPMFSQAVGPDTPPAGASEPLLSASLLDGGAQFGLNLGAPVRLRLWGGGELYVLGQGGTLLFARGQEMMSPGAFASLGLGVDHAR